MEPMGEDEAGELVGRALKGDQDAIEILRERREEGKRIAAEAILEAEPLMEILRQRGLVRSSLTDLPGPPAYRDSVPLLLEWFRSAKAEGLKTALAGTLGWTWGGTVGAEVYQSLRRALTETSTDGELRWALGMAVAGAAGPEHADDVLEMARDPRLGIARGRMIVALVQMGRVGLGSDIVDLLNDPATTVEVAEALGTLRYEPATERLRELVHHGTDLEREAAKEALVRIKG